MAATMIFAGAIAAVYGILIAMHVAAIRARGPADDRYRPRLAVWLASAGDRRRARIETEAAHDLVAGRLTRDRYRATMAAMAAQDDVEHPLAVPKA
ncbi:hypothetical protein ACFFX1_52440 [Dactylosporangium sucinum]|uniref:Uncharacterized protein n=1 Tax=Dactylosporangium sucinum TaxID=1424081 RepID=A0A917UBN8_9ACTN|nr:hypothetical protein [Dactylosporangium sucinum]GGM77241.1 hypothetical protein GCM10007977_093430 [Dactylosporangium sucinum]GGM77917.1 hypothetical protein GCM10007977_094260 [Dactylosporangium sucinum]